MKKSVKQLIKRTPIFKYIKKSLLYKFYSYQCFKKYRKNLLLQEAENEFQINSIDNEIREDYFKSFNKTLCSYSEFMHQYEFYKLSDTERYEYVSRLEMRLYYERHKSDRVQDIFWKKTNWLKFFHNYIHRSWLDISKVCYEEFKSYVEEGKFYIAKPAEGSLGEGIFKISTLDVTEDLYIKLYKYNYIIEECVYNESSLREFHPFSLNTIRVVTLNNGSIVGTFIRWGNNGNIVDNAHAGGIFARINPETGIVDTDGIDTSGNKYIFHPYADKKIKGLEIPRWSEILQVLIEMHRMIPEAPIVGWDVCVSSANQIEVIEGNHLPDVDLLQSPAKEGLRQQLNSKLISAGLPLLN